MFWVTHILDCSMEDWRGGGQAMVKWLQCVVESQSTLSLYWLWYLAQVAALVRSTSYLQSKQQQLVGLKMEQTQARRTREPSQKLVEERCYWRGLRGAKNEMCTSEALIVHGIQSTSVLSSNSNQPLFSFLPVFVPPLDIGRTIARSDNGMMIQLLNNWMMGQTASK